MVERSSNKDFGLLSESPEWRRAMADAKPPCTHCGGDGESGYCPGPVDFDGPYPCPRCLGSGVEPGGC